MQTLLTSNKLRVYNNFSKGIRIECEYLTNAENAYTLYRVFI